MNINLFFKDLEKKYEFLKIRSGLFLLNCERKKYLVCIINYEQTKTCNKIFDIFFFLIGKNSTLRSFLKIIEIKHLKILNALFS